MIELTALHIYDDVRSIPKCILCDCHKIFHQQLCRN